MLLQWVIGKTWSIHEHEESLEIQLTQLVLSENFKFNWHLLGEGSVGLQWCVRHENMETLLCLYSGSDGEERTRMYWHQHIVTTWVTRQPDDRRGSHIYNSHTSSTLGGVGTHGRCGTKAEDAVLQQAMYYKFLRMGPVFQSQQVWQYLPSPRMTRLHAFWSNTLSLRRKSTCYIILKSQRVKAKDKNSGMVSGFILLFKDLFILLFVYGWGCMCLWVPSTSKRGSLVP